MINVTLNDILNAVPVFQELTQKNFKGVASFKIAKLVRELDKELKTFDETREKLIKEYAEKDDNGEVAVNEQGMANVATDKIEEYNKQMMDTLALECEVNADKLDASYFDDVEMTPAQSMAIMNFVE